MSILNRILIGGNSPKRIVFSEWGFRVRVLLTGGYGCIGSWIVRNLLERDERAWIYDLKEDPRRLRMILPEENVRQVRFVQGDVTDLAALRSALAQYSITHIVHLAGLQVPTCRADPILGAKVNVLGTLAVFAVPSIRRMPWPAADEPAWQAQDPPAGDSPVPARPAS